MSVSSLCIAAAVPATTALRWIKTMTDAGLFLLEADPDDGRRIFIALAEGAFEAMARAISRRWRNKGRGKTRPPQPRLAPSRATP